MRLRTIIQSLLCGFLLGGTFPVLGQEVGESIEVIVHENGQEKKEEIGLPLSMTYPIDSLLADWKVKNLISLLHLIMAAAYLPKSRLPMQNPVYHLHRVHGFAYRIYPYRLLFSHSPHRHRLCCISQTCSIYLSLSVYFCSGRIS